MINVEFKDGDVILYNPEQNIVILTETEARTIALNILGYLADKGDDWIGDALNCIPKEYF